MASVDYDPVKAHEYYERTKRLKGRRSTKGFSQIQKEQLAYAKEQLKQQQKHSLQKLKQKSKLEKLILFQNVSL